MSTELSQDLRSLVEARRRGTRQPTRPEPEEVRLARDAVEAAEFGHRDPNAVGSASLVEALVEHMRPAYSAELADVVLDELLVDPARAIAEHKPAAPRGATRRGVYTRHLSTARTIGAVLAVRVAFARHAPTV